MKKKIRIKWKNIILVGLVLGLLVTGGFYLYSNFFSFGVDAETKSIKIEKKKKMSINLSCLWLEML